MRLFNRVLETLNLDLKSLGIESLQEEQVEWTKVKSEIQNGITE